MASRTCITVTLSLLFWMIGCQPYQVPAVKDLAYRSSPPALTGRVIKASVMEMVVQPQEKPDEKIAVRIAPDTYIVTETGGSWPGAQSMVGLTAKVWLQEGGRKEKHAPLVAAVIQLEKAAK